MDQESHTTGPEVEPTYKTLGWEGPVLSAEMLDQGPGRDQHGEHDRNKPAQTPSRALYTAPLTLPAECVDVPTSGPLWLIKDHANVEAEWRDVTAVAECELGDRCDVLRDPDAELCVVLVSATWSDGFKHLAAYATVDVRIPAVTR